jgi:cytochrome c oxidase assembly protein subunit 15
MSNDAGIPRWYFTLLSVSAVMTYLLIVMGGVVCMTGSGLGCPDWPTCYGRLLPPPDLAAIIEMTHRFFAVTTTPLLVAVAVVGWRRYPSIWWLRWPPTLAVLLALVVSVFGAFAVLTGLPPILAAVDLGSALLVLALVVATWGAARLRQFHSSLPDRLAFHTPVARLTFAALIATFLVLLSGIFTAEPGSIARCVGWPLYGPVAEAAEAGRLLPLARRALGLAAAGLILAALVRAWGLGHAPIRRVVVVTALALAAEAGLGALLPLHGFSLVAAALYTAAASALWALLALLTALTGLTSDADRRSAP